MFFLSEQIRPVYLRARIFEGPSWGPPESAAVRTAYGKKLPEQASSICFRSQREKSFTLAMRKWYGNNVISSIALDAYLGLKNGAVANGMEMEAAPGTDTAKSTGGRGYLDATVQPGTSFDDAAHTVS